MKKYIGVKIIEAESMNLGDYNTCRGWIIPEDENPNREGYKIIYPDDYISWSPKEIFDEAYRLTDGLTFGLAVEALKKGFKLARNGWNGKGMFIYYVPENSYPALTNIAKKEFGDTVLFNAYLAIKNVNGIVSTWVPSINDCLAEDWQIVE
jgi:hypothetical protein